MKNNKFKIIIITCMNTLIYYCTTLKLRSTLAVNTGISTTFTPMH